MITFEVKDMTCGHCVSAITRALQAVDAGAVVHVDLVRHLVTVEPTTSDSLQLQAAIAGAGYTPAVAERPVTVDAPARRPCCGCS